MRVGEFMGRESILLGKEEDGVNEEGEAKVEVEEDSF